MENILEGKKPLRQVTNSQKERMCYYGSTTKASLYGSRLLRFA